MLPLWMALLTTGRQILHYCFPGTRHQSPRTSVAIQGHFIQPDVIRLLLVVSVELKCDVDLFLITGRLCRVIRIDVIFLVADIEGHVMNLVAHTFQIPGQMNPRFRREMVAGHVGWNPYPMQWIPNIPPV